MALLGSPAFPVDDREDSDFFEQLANDLGNGDHVSDPANHDYQQQDADFNEVFSKLSMSGSGSVHVTPTIAEDNGKIDSAADEFWLEDTVREPFAASLVKATGPEESVGEMINNHTASDFQTEVNGDSDIQVPPASVEAVVGDPQENATVQPLQSNLPLGERGSTSDMGDLDVTVGAEMLSDSSVPVALDPSERDHTKLQASSNVKQLQWSSLSEVFTEEAEQGAFGSYLDFLTDLDADTEPIFNSQSISQSPSGWTVETLTHEGTTNPVNLGVHSADGQEQSIADNFNKRVHDHEMELTLQGGLKLGHCSTAETSAQMLERPEAEAQGDQLSNGMYETQDQGVLQQSWENMYPGWFYDYASNEWRQIEGFTSGAVAGLMENPVSASNDGADDFSSGKNEVLPSQMEVMSQGDQFLNTATGFSQVSTWHGAQEYVTLSSEEPMEVTRAYASASVHEQQLAHNVPEPQQQVYWEDQYPGWYYDYQAQEWRQSAQSRQSDGPSQGMGLAAQVADSADVSRGDSSLVSPMPQGGWMEHQSEYQYDAKQNIFWPERSQNSGGNMTAISRGMSFNSWAASDVGRSSTQQSSDGILNETFQGSGVGKEAWNGLPGYENSVANLYGQSQPEYAQVKADVFGNQVPNQAPFSFSHVQQYAQTHNAPRTVTEGLRSSAGRPPHALAAFGFGGKLATMKATSSVQVGLPGPIALHNLNHLLEAAHNSGQNGALNHHGLAGPLIGGGVTTKELFKWIDERAENCELEDPYCTNPKVLRILWNVLKIACMHYGKLRSVVGSGGIKSQAEDGPEGALGRLFAAANSDSHWNSPLDALQSVPTEHQLQATALEMKRNLVAGKRKEALQLAQQGQLWGPALVLAWQLGEKFYADTVSQMAQQQFVPGSPLRTLFLLFAGQATELFSAQNLPSPVAVQGPYSIGSHSSAKDSAGGMLGGWLENLSVIAANRTKGDEQVITHLGDCLWKDRGEVAGAHTCYLVAEANFEPFSKSARLCLLGADHFKHQRTFATSQAIQRTELYEYAKVLGNPQYILVPFQPYKLLYAHMLAEAGKISEARRYCQAVSKTLRNAGRAPDVELCRQSAAALDDRLRLHSQGGYSLNSATGKLVGKFFGTIDSTIHKIIGGPPPPQVSESSQPSTSINNGGDWYPNDQRMRHTATRTSSPLVPSASINNLFNANNQVEVPPRSISEPDFSRSPTQEISSSSVSSELKAPVPKNIKTESSGGGYFGRFGTQFLAKAVGLIKPNKKEAKLGDKNKFYYDNELKRWVEEGAEEKVDDVSLPPPPIGVDFNSNMKTPASDVKPHPAIEGQGFTASGPFSSSPEMPPMPPSVNQFSARGRLHGVRSRYVDTFNKGGTKLSPSKPMQSPIVPATGWGATSTPAQLFVPASISEPANDFGQTCDNGQFKSELHSDTIANTPLNGNLQDECDPLLPKNLSSSFMAVPAMQRHSSASNVAVYTNNESAVTASTNGGMSKSGESVIASFPRAVSWSGNSTTSSNTDMPAFKSIHSGTPAMHRPSLPFMKADLSRATDAGVSSFCLPSPPIIEPPPSYIGNESTLLPGAREGLLVPATLNRTQGGMPSDMQEVEL